MTEPTAARRASEQRPATEASQQRAAAEQVSVDELPSSSFQLRVNGEAHQISDAWVGESLLFVLRSRLGLTGAKDGCGSGECGACSVLLDDALVCACLVPAAAAAGRAVRTIEGLTAGSLTDVQLALLAAGGVQCGFCTPALTLALHALLAAEPEPDEAQIREALVGNMCRCTGFGRVLSAARLVIDRRREAGHREAPASSGASDLPDFGPDIPEIPDGPAELGHDEASAGRLDVSARDGGLVPRLDPIPLIDTSAAGEVAATEPTPAPLDWQPSPGEPR